MGSNTPELDHRRQDAFEHRIASSLRLADYNEEKGIRSSHAEAALTAKLAGYPYYRGDLGRGSVKVPMFSASPPVQAWEDIGRPVGPMITVEWNGEDWEIEKIESFT